MKICTVVKAVSTINYMAKKKNRNKYLQRVVCIKKKRKEFECF